MRLSARALACRRGGRDLFTDLTFSIPAGEMLAVTGRNGAGKSSLLRLVAGLLRPAAGSLELEGGERERSIAEQAHYLGHQDALKPAFTLGETLTFWARYLGGDPGPVEEALEQVGLGGLAGYPAAVLSAGQARRLGLARLLVAHRPLWLLDEPTTALDADGRRRLDLLLGEHLGHGGMALIATHAEMTGRMARLELGQTR